MSFASLRYFVFLAAVLVLLRLVRGSERQKVVLAVASCLFYAAWDYRYLALLLLVSGIDYACGAWIASSSDARVRRFWLAVSIVSNLGILGYFKYYGFMAGNLRGLGFDIPFKDILLPAGISFYTFKSMSYTIDVYWRHITATRHWRDYVTFVTFFPELIAGPIVRASAFLPQMSREIGPTSVRLRDGLSLFLIGLTKKVLVADHLAPVADQVFANPAIFSTMSVWAGVLAYSFQIYCDFSGYSDMAIGTAKMIGYDLPENFNMPYLSASVAEFWRRWHMTLSAWLRDYLYIPLGGNRRGGGRAQVNLFITMLLGGLWHGASWNFVLWGSLHGAALGLHRMWSSRGHRLPSIVSTPLTFAFVTLCWVPFRAVSTEGAIEILRRLAGLESDGGRWMPEALLWCLALIVLGHALGLAARKGNAAEWFSRFDAEVVEAPLAGTSVRLGARTFGGAFLVTFWVLGLFYFAAARSSPFIYFQF